MTDAQLTELLKQYSPAIRDAIIAGIREIRDNVVLKQVVEMVERGDVEGALRALGYNPAVFNTYYMTMMRAAEAGGAILMAALPKYGEDAAGLKFVNRFNVRDRDMEKWLGEKSSSLIINIEEDMRFAVRSIMQQGASEGRNPRNIALDIVGRMDRTTGKREGGAIGLGEREIYWSNNARTKLLNLDKSYFDMKLRDARFDSVVRKAIEEGKPLSQDTVDKLTDRYRARALLHRGETIGRTEALSALNKSEYEATRQALAKSDLPLEAAKKVWDSAGDGRVRHTHREMDGQTVGIDEPFVSPSGARLMHPHDTSLNAPGAEVIDCRCKVRYEIDYLWRYR